MLCLGQGCFACVAWVLKFGLASWGYVFRDLLYHSRQVATYSYTFIFGKLGVSSFSLDHIVVEACRRSLRLWCRGAPCGIARSAQGPRQLRNWRPHIGPPNRGADLTSPLTSSYLTSPQLTTLPANLTPRLISQHLISPPFVLTAQSPNLPESIVRCEVMAEAAVPEIENPRRVLVVSLEGESHHLGRVVKGTALPLPVTTSVPLLAHPHRPPPPGEGYAYSRLDLEHP